MPDVPPPSRVPSLDELEPDREERLKAVPLFRNLEQRIVDETGTGRDESRPPRQLQWIKLRPKGDYGDPYLNAARYMLFMDLAWEAAKLPHPNDAKFFAPTLTLSAHFHSFSSESWVLCDACAPVAERGMIDVGTRLWTPGGELLASSSGALLCRMRSGQRMP